MCFETTKTARVKIAKTDIKCWKVLYPQIDGRIFSYTPNKTTKTVKLEKMRTEEGITDTKTSPQCYIIGRGYHSYKTLKDAKKSILMSETKKIYMFIIPKGAHYYKNKTEYVSETIILIK